MYIDKIKVAVSVVIYNTQEWQLSRLLNAIIDSGSIQVVYIVDNSPRSIESSLYHLPIVKYIKSTKNVGYGAGHNIALKESILQNDFHFVINPDIYFEAGELNKMIERMLVDKDIGQLMPMVNYPNGELQYLCKLIPTPFDLFFRRFMVGPLKTLFKNNAYKFELRFTGYDREMNVPYLSGCFMLFRSTALIEIGLFDERFFMYPEDIDITRRMHASYKTLFFPDAKIVHDHARESYKSLKMFWIHLSNLIKYFNKWGWIIDNERTKINTSTLIALGYLKK